MIEKSTLLEVKDNSLRFLTPEDFFRTFLEVFHYEGFQDIKVYSHVGDMKTPVEFMLPVLPSNDDSGDICRVNEPEFIKNVLKTIQPYRFIRRRKDELYRFLGDYSGYGSGYGIGNLGNLDTLGIVPDEINIIVISGKPVLELMVNIPKDDSWIVKPFGFVNYTNYNGNQGQSHFNVCPDFTNPLSPRVKLSLLEDNRGESFVEWYNLVVEGYKERNFKILEDNHIDTQKTP